MKKFTNVLRLIAILGLTSVLFSSCVKKDFDAPATSNIDPALTVTHSIAQLVALATSVVPREITTDMIISGIVIADDSSGNYYKEMIIQDSLTGLSVQLDVSNFHTDYPVGRRVFIKCKGLYVANDGDNNTQIGIKDAGVIGRIPASLVSYYIVKGKWGQYISPNPVSLSNLTNVKSNTLILLSDVEFKGSDYGVAYANAATLTFKNRSVGDCSGNVMNLYTSGYAKFASSITPTGKGTMMAVYKLYSGAGELTIRDTKDVNMPSLRCDGSTGLLTQMSMDSLRMVFTGTLTYGPSGKKVKGIVISDYLNGNLDPKNLVVQDGNSGIVVRFTSAHSFPLGAQIEVPVSGVELSEFNGLLQLNRVDVLSVIQVGTGTVAPRIATIGDILINYNAWESTLVKVQAATITSASGTYSGSNTLTDSTGNIVMFTKFSTPAATFVNDSCLTGPRNVTGILGEYTTGTFNPQISMRNLGDIQ